MLSWEGGKETKWPKIDPKKGGQKRPLFCDFWTHSRYSYTFEGFWRVLETSFLGYFYVFWWFLIRCRNTREVKKSRKLRNPESLKNTRFWLCRFQVSIGDSTFFQKNRFFKILKIEKKTFEVRVFRTDIFLNFLWKFFRKKSIFENHFSKKILQQGSRVAF